MKCVFQILTRWSRAQDCDIPEDANREKCSDQKSKVRKYKSATNFDAWIILWTPRYHGYAWSMI